MVSLPNIKDIVGAYNTFGGKPVTIPEPTKQDLAVIKEWKKTKIKNGRIYSFDMEELYTQAVKNNNLFQLAWLLNIRDNDGDQHYAVECTSFVEHILKGLRDKQMTPSHLDLLDYAGSFAPKMFYSNSYYTNPWSIKFAEGDDLFDEYVLKNVEIDTSLLCKAIRTDNEGLFNRCIAANPDLKNDMVSCMTEALKKGDPEWLGRLIEICPSIVHDEKAVSIMTNVGLDMDMYDCAIQHGMEASKLAYQLSLKATNPGRIKNLRDVMSRYNVPDDIFDEKIVRVAVDRQSPDLIAFLAERGAPMLSVFDVLTGEGADSNPFAQSLKTIFMPISSKETETKWALNNDAAIIKSVAGTQVSSITLYDFQEGIIARILTWHGQNEMKTSDIKDMKPLEGTAELTEAIEEFVKLGGDKKLVNPENKTLLRPVVSVVDKKGQLGGAS